MAVRSQDVTLPRRRNRTTAVLVLALLAGLLAMHGLSGTALAGPPHQVMPAAMSMDMTGGHDVHGALPAAPSPAGPHHGPAVTGHHPCLAAPTAAVVLTAPADMATPALPMPQRTATTSAPARARADRAPPDLFDLCVSRT